MTDKEKKFQLKLLKKLRSGKEHVYEDASIYTVLLDLVEGNGADEVRDVLDLVIKDFT